MLRHKFLSPPTNTLGSSSTSLPFLCKATRSTCNLGRLHTSRKLQALFLSRRWRRHSWSKALRGARESPHVTLLGIDECSFEIAHLYPKPHKCHTERYFLDGSAGERNLILFSVFLISNYIILFTQLIFFLLLFNVKKQMHNEKIKTFFCSNYKKVMN